MQKLSRITELYNKYLNEFSDEQVVPGDGNLDADIVLIGEAPGKEEVVQKKPFVGAAGKNLDAFIKYMLIKRESIYITNAIKYRLYKINPDTHRLSNRPATKDEIVSSRQFLLEEISIINPKYVVTLGNVSLRSVLGDWNSKIGDMHGAVRKVYVFNKEYALFPLYHPASIIYNRNLNDIYEKDLQRLRDIIKTSD